MLAIIAVHVAVAAAVMSAKMDLPQRIRNAPILVDFIKDQEPPPPAPELHAKLPKQPSRSVMDQPTAVVPLPQPGNSPVDPALLPDLGAIIGPAPTLSPHVDPVPSPALAKSPARLLTLGSELRPPYPASKLLAGDEATLRLKLTIDERGRVVAVDPVGSADRAFLDAARRHLTAHWRYKPATEDGRAVASTLVVTLRFQLDD
jgi:protein TonB